MSLAESLPITEPLTEERADLAAAFRWSARLNMHEAVANHFSLAVNDDGTQFLINPKNRHFARIKASDLLLLDANDPATMDRPDAPDPTAWGLHGAVHRLCPHARCAVHLHPMYATVLACLKDPLLPPINQTAASFFGAQAVDLGYDGLAFEEEAERTCAFLKDPKMQVLIMGNHGVMTIGRTVAEAFDRMYYFERACQNYVQALWTGKPLNILSDAVAAKTSAQIAEYGHVGEDHLREIRAILDAEGSDYAH
ncbi:MAG: class II aldolase and adducin N-terminal domain-containing protein [Pseudomonadota bacterium]